MTILSRRKPRIGAFQVASKATQGDLPFCSATSQKRHSLYYKPRTSFYYRDLMIRLCSPSFRLLLYRGKRIGVQAFATPFKELITCISEHVRCLTFAYDAYGCAALAKLSAEISEVGVACHQAEQVSSLIKKSFLRVQSQSYIRGILARGVRILETGGESQPHQSILPFIS